MNRLQGQYQGTNIETLCNGLERLYDKLITQPIQDFYENFYNLDTATGDGLDCWGELFQLPRCVKYIDMVTAVDTVKTLTDDEYRFLLQILSLGLYIKMTIPEINKAVSELFSNYGLDAYTLDSQNMRYVTYIFIWELPEYLEKVLIEYEILPHPLAVGTRYRESYYQYFGFKGQLMGNFYRSIFYKKTETE